MKKINGSRQISSAASGSNQDNIVIQAKDLIKERYNIAKNHELNKRTYKRYQVPKIVQDLFSRISQNPSEELLQSLRDTLYPKTDQTPQITPSVSPSNPASVTQLNSSGATIDNINLTAARTSDLQTSSVTAEQRAEYEKILRDISSIIEKEDKETQEKLLASVFEAGNPKRKTRVDEFYATLPSNANSLTPQIFSDSRQLSLFLKQAVSVTPEQIDDYRKIVDNINRLIAIQSDKVLEDLFNYTFTYQQESRTEQTTVLKFLRELPSKGSLITLAESGRFTLSNFNQLFKSVNQLNQFLTSTVIPALSTSKPIDNVDNKPQVTFSIEEVSEIQGKLSELEGSLTRLAPDKDHQHSLLRLKVIIGEKSFTVEEIIDFAKKINEKTIKPDIQAHKTVLDQISKALLALTQQGQSLINKIVEFREYQRILKTIQGILTNEKFPKEDELGEVSGLDSERLDKLKTAISKVKKIDVQAITLDAQVQVTGDELVELLKQVNSILAKKINNEEAKAPTVGITDEQKDALRRLVAEL